MLKPFVCSILAAALVAEWAAAQSVIPVGAGSYASFPPPQANAGGTPNSPSSYLFAANGKPIPSNKWWTDLITRRYAGNMWAYPLTVSADAQGINIYNPVTWVPSENNPQLALNAPITLRGQSFSPADARDCVDKSGRPDCERRQDQPVIRSRGKQSAQVLPRPANALRSGPFGAGTMEAGTTAGAALIKFLKSL